MKKLPRKSIEYEETIIIGFATSFVSAGMALFALSYKIDIISLDGLLMAGVFYVLSVFFNLPAVALARTLVKKIYTPM